MIVWYNLTLCYLCAALLFAVQITSSVQPCTTVVNTLGKIVLGQQPSMGNECLTSVILGLMQVPSSPLLPAALSSLLAALTAACQQGGDAALANRLKALFAGLAKAQAHSSTSASGVAILRQKMPVSVITAINVGLDQLMYV